MEIKKKHHYVSQFYLRTWSNDDERLPTIINNKIVVMKTKEVAHQNHFYRLNGITLKEHNYLTQFNENLAPEVLKADIQNVIDASFAIGQIKNPNNLEQKEKFRANFFEEIFSEMESSAKLVIDKLLNEKLENFSFEDFVLFVRFCSLQLAKTSAVRNNQNIHNLAEFLKDKEIEFNDVYIITTNLIIPEKLADNLLCGFYQMELIENDTHLDFITTDNPAINLHEQPEGKNALIYFPISPKKAVILSKKDLSENVKKQIMESKSEIRYFCKSTKEDNIDRIHKLNLSLAKKSDRFIFSKDSNTLALYTSV